MNKDTLLEEVRKVELALNLAERYDDIDHYLADSVWYLIDCINKLDEPQKPVIPQFVADFIESQDDPIYEMCVNYEMWGVNGDDGTTRFTGELSEWFDDTLNVENYYRACIDGYEVEKEKKYRVVFRSHKDDLILFKTGEHIFIGAESANGGYWKQHFTESEIKAIDERYWAFAEPV